MMGGTGSSNTVGAMHFATSGLALAFGAAVQAGFEHARAQAEIDAIHADGQRYVVARRQQRKQAALQQASVKKNRLMSLRQDLHG